MRLILLWRDYGREIKDFGMGEPRVENKPSRPAPDEHRAVGEHGDSRQETGLIQISQ